MKAELSKLKKILVKNKFILLILLAATLLRVPSLFEPYWYGDEGIYLTLGQAVRKGLVLYKDIYDNKPPLLYLLATISGNLFWFRFILLIWNSLTIYLFYSLSKIFFSRKPKLSLTATSIFALLSSVPLIEGNIANAEIFMILPILAGIFLVLREKVKTSLVWLATGFLFSLAALFKVPAAFDFAGLFIFLVLFQTKNRKIPFLPQLQEIKNLFLLAVGFLLPIVFTFLYFWSQNTLSQYWTAAFAQNLPYLSSWQTGNHSTFAASGLAFRATVLGLIVAALWWLRTKFSPTTLFLFLWFVFALFAAALSGRPYPHYLIQVLPSFSVLVAIVFGFKLWSKIVSILLLGILILLIVTFKVWSYPTFNYYQNFLSFAFGQKSELQYFQWFNPKVPQTYRLAEFLSTHTLSNEKVFLWGDSPTTYALANRLPVGPYTASYHIMDFNGKERTMAALKKEKPAFIIDLQDEGRPFPELRALLSQNYFPVAKIDNAQVFYLLP